MTLVSCMGGVIDLIYWAYLWTIMTHHDPSWPIMTHHDPSWTIMNHHEPSWTIMNHHEPSWTIMNHHEPYTLGHQSNIFSNQLSCVSLLGGAFHFVMSYTSSYICNIPCYIYLYTIYGMIWLVYWLYSTEWGPHIQDDLGLAVADSDGAPLGAWTFNLSFNLATSLYSEDGDSDGRFNHQQRMKSGKFHGNRMVKPTLVYRTLDFMDLNAFFFSGIFEQWIFQLIWWEHDGFPNGDWMGYSWGYHG